MEYRPRELPLQGERFGVRDSCSRSEFPNPDPNPEPRTPKQLRILSRYVLWEHVGPFVFALTTLTSLLLLNQVAKQFGKLVGKGLGWAVIGEFFTLSVPFIVAMSLPMAVLVAVLYAFSRLGAENEVTALRASGVSVFRLVRPVLAAGLFVAGFMLFFNDQVLPASNARLATLQSDIARTKPTFALREQVINEVSPGRLYLRAARVDDATSALRDVTIYDLGDATRRRTIHADSGLMALAANREDLQLTLFNGYSQEIPLENPAQLQRVHFGVDFIRVRGVTSEFDRSQETISRSEREMSICEMETQAVRRRRELHGARRELSDRYAAMTWKLATGETRHYPPVPPPSKLTLSTIYCDHLLPLVQVSRAEAQETVQRPRTIEDAGGPLRRLPARNPEGKIDQKERPDSARLIAAPRSAPMEPVAPVPVDLHSFLGMLEMQRVLTLEAELSLSKLTLEMHKKFALAFACVVFVLIGAPIALRFPRGGVGMVIGASLAVFSVYYVGLIGGESLADRLVLHPVLAMWAANIIFTIVGILLLWQARRSGATTRGGDAAELLDVINVRLARLLRRPVPLPRPRPSGGTAR